MICKGVCIKLGFSKQFLKIDSSRIDILKRLEIKSYGYFLEHVSQFSKIFI